MKKLIIFIMLASVAWAQPEAKLLENAQNGDVKAQMELSKYYFVHEDYTQSTQWLLKAEASGDLEARHMLALNYLIGIGIEKNTSKAVELFDSAGKAGYVSSQALLGLLYKNGDLIPADTEKALYWLRKAADNDSGEAMDNLGYMYLSGIGVKVDKKKAAQYYIQSAENGFPRGMYNAGIMYRDGEGVKQDLDTALKYFLQAVDAGHIGAANDAAVIYMDKDSGKAEKYFLIGASKGDKGAQANLGYFLAFMTKSDLIAGCAWSSIAQEEELIGMCNNALDKDNQQLVVSKIAELKLAYGLK